MQHELCDQSGTEIIIDQRIIDPDVIHKLVKETDPEEN